jgi:hypothetical protein
MPLSSTRAIRLTGAIVLNKALEGKDDFGFNAQTETYEKLIAAVVIGPTKVERFAVQNAASVAGLMLTTEAMVAEKPKKKKAPAMPAEGMDADMYRWSPVRKTPERVSCPLWLDIGLCAAHQKPPCESTWWSNR